MNYLRAQVIFRQLRAETAGNRYLRRFLPASAGIFTCGSVYLRPSQLILHAPVLQCIVSQNQNIEVKDLCWALWVLKESHTCSSCGKVRGAENAVKWKSELAMNRYQANTRESKLKGNFSKLSSLSTLM